MKTLRKRLKYVVIVQNLDYFMIMLNSVQQPICSSCVADSSITAFVIKYNYYLRCYKSAISISTNMPILFFCSVLHYGRSLSLWCLA